MQREAVGARAVVQRCPQRVAGREDPSLWPPQRHFLPRLAHADGAELERPERLSRDDVMLDAESSCELGAVAVVPVEQLDNARRGACRADTLLHVLAVDRIDQPDATAVDERVRAALHELVGDTPLEAARELAEIHAADSMVTP